MKKIRYIMIALLIIAIFSLSVISMNQKEESTLVSATAVSNKKIGWGIKRNNNHEQPDVGANNKKVLEEYNGICLGSNESKTIYLTFDEGYEAGYTQQILKVLKENKVPATFFITAHYVNTQPDLVEQMIKDGHIVGNHISLTLMPLKK